MTRLLLIAAYGAGAIALLALFLVPTRSFAGWIHADPALLAKAAGLLTFLAGFAGALAWALRAFLLAPPTTAPACSPLHFGPSHRFWGYVNVALVVLILGQTFRSLDTPLDIDENIHALMMARERYAEELNPIKSEATIYFTQNHVVAQAASILGMKLGGIGKIPYRFPALLFTAGLLLLIPLFYRRLFFTPGCTLLYGFLFCNAFSFWYCHSARGYVTLMLVTLATTLAVLRALESGLDRRTAGLFGVSLLLSAFVHFFAMVFQLFLLVALILYGYFQRRALSPERRQGLGRLILLSFSVIPLYAVVLGHNLVFLARIGDFQKAEPVALGPNVMKALGLAFEWQARALGLVTLGILAYALLHRRSLWQRFSTLLLIVSVGFVGAMLSLVDAKVFESRFILILVLPFGVWLIDSLFALLPRWRAGAVLAILLILFPLLGGPSIYRTLTLNLAAFDTFMTAAQQRTRPVENNCFFFSGKRDLCIFAKDFYFRAARESVYSDEAALPCENFYHLRIEPSEAPVTWEAPHQATELWNDGHGMALYAQSRSSHLASMGPRGR